MGIGIKLGIDIGSKLGASPYGDELINEGDFSNGGAAWFVSGESTVNTGVGRIYSSAGSYSAINQADVWEVGKTYKIEYDVVDDTVVGNGLRSANSLIIFPATLGHHSIIAVADNTIFTMKRSSGIIDVSVDNISVREIL